MLLAGIIPTGSIVNDRYEVRGRIGSHGLLERILAFDRVAGRDVVIEVGRPETKMPARDDAEEWVPLAQRVRHPNVCRVHGLERCPWGPIVITEYVAGPSLHKLLRARKAEGGMSTDEFRSIATGLFGGLAAMHAEGVIHGDVKPGKSALIEPCLHVPATRTLGAFECRRGACTLDVQAFSAQAERKLVMLDSADAIEDLRSPPGNRLEALQGDRRGQHSIRINDQYRICFRWTENGPEDVEIVDYH